MKNILAKAVAALVILASSVYANASIITLNGSQEVNALKINESFESFYNFCQMLYDNMCFFCDFFLKKWPFLRIK